MCPATPPATPCVPPFVTHSLHFVTPPPALLHKILTENPAARITIPDIKKDRWYSKPLKKGKGMRETPLSLPKKQWGSYYGVSSSLRRHQAGTGDLGGGH